MGVVTLYGLGLKERLAKFKLIIRPISKNALSILLITFCKAAPKGEEGFTLLIELFTSSFIFSFTASFSIPYSWAIASISSSVTFSSTKPSKTFSCSSFSI